MVKITFDLNDPKDSLKNDKAAQTVIPLSHSHWKSTTAGVLHQYPAGLMLVDRKGKPVRCGKYGNVGHNRKGCRGQGGATQAAGARTVSSQGCARRTDGARNVSSQASARQAVVARTIYGQAGNASSQPSAAPSTTSQGPTQHSAGLRQGFQAPRPGFPTQRLTKAIASRYNPRKMPS
ncbi:hypothetical protein Tco_1379259 [Tanacetum coccineum]